MTLKKILSFLLLLEAGHGSYAQTEPGSVSGYLADEKGRSLPAATLVLLAYDSSKGATTAVTGNDGRFLFSPVPFNRYRLTISFVGYRDLVVDSILTAPDHPRVVLDNLLLHPEVAGGLAEVVVFARKPMVESKDGNITFNTAESPLSSGGSAADLLKNTPLVSAGADGKILVRGREPKILIDDKPVELTLQQLQDFLESMPGSSIEKIEVLTNPPPQYANEPGGVINIVTRKNVPGIGGRASLSAGTRGDYGVYGSAGYRKNGFSVNISGGTGFGRYTGDGYAQRKRLYSDSVSYFNSDYRYNNNSRRPGTRLAIDYTIGRAHSLSLTAQENRSVFHNTGENHYASLDEKYRAYRLSRRYSDTRGQSSNPMLSAGYTWRGSTEGELLRITASVNSSDYSDNRWFYEQYLQPGGVFAGADSTQRQYNRTRNSGVSTRLNYDKPLFHYKTFVSVGGYYSGSSSHVRLQSNNLDKADNLYVSDSVRSNDFRFRQSVTGYRAAVRQVLAEGFSVLAGAALEQTAIGFLLTKGSNAHNRYSNWLPFARISRNWKNGYSLSMAYRSAVGRPGIGQLNPSVDYSNPYTLHSGNPYLRPALSHQIDLTAGRTRTAFYVNIGLGYNSVSSVFQQLRSLLPDGRSQLSWYNISNRHEYQASTWSGYTFSGKLRVNFSATYAYNRYSAYDKEQNHYRDGGSLNSNLNTSFTPGKEWNFTGSLVYNRFANPQGTVNNRAGMNFGMQKKFLSRKLAVTINAINPFADQRSSVYSEGTDFMLMSYSAARTRNYRLSLAYTFTRTPRATKLNESDRDRLKGLLR